MENINDKYRLKSWQGSSQKINTHTLIAHSTATPNAPASAIARNMYNSVENNGAYVHYIVDDKEIYQVGALGYKAWGCGEPGNSYGMVQVELCEFTDVIKALKAYHRWVVFIQDCCQQFSIPLTLDDDKLEGVKTHNWVTKNLGGTDHVDPYSYLLQLGITYTTLKNDIQNKNPNVVTISNYKKGYGVNSYRSDGKQNLGTNKKLLTGTSWKTFGVYLINNEPMYKIGNNEFLPQKYTNFHDKIRINYETGYGVNAYDNNFDQILRTNKKFKTGTEWKFSKVVEHDYRIYYQVSKTEKILSLYTCGGGYGIV